MLTTKLNRRSRDRSDESPKWLQASAVASTPLGLSWVAASGEAHEPVESARRNAALREQNEPAEILLFDVFGTVVELQASLLAQFQQFGIQHGYEADWKALVFQWQASYLPSLEDIKQKRRPFVSLEVLRRENLDCLLPTFGLGTLSDAERGELVRCWARLEAWPDTVAGLTRLNANLSLSPSPMEVSACS